MPYLACRVTFALTFVFFLVGLCFAQTQLRINEAATRIEIRDDGSTVELRLENSIRETFSANVRIELVDPLGVVQAHADQDVSLPPGSTKLKMTLPAVFAQNGNEPNWKNLLWYRRPSLPA